MNSIDSISVTALPTEQYEEYEGNSPPRSSPTHTAEKTEDTKPPKDITTSSKDVINSDINTQKSPSNETSTEQESTLPTATVERIMDSEPKPLRPHLDNLRTNSYFEVPNNTSMTTRRSMGRVHRNAAANPGAIMHTPAT